MNYENMTVKEIKTHLDQIDINNLAEELEKLKADNRSTVIKLVNTYLKKIDNYNKELKRLEQMSSYENALYSKGLQYIAGVDEAGRGPLAGPVFAAAVILPQNIKINGINDSKKLTAQKREELYDIIIDKALAYCIVSVSAEEIDRINIRNATQEAMLAAIKDLSITPQHVLIDGEDLENISIPYTTIVKGDSLSISIAAASILAKVSRDRYIQSFDSIYPEYGFKKHKGYGTKEHIEAIKKHGLCPIHRKSFTTHFV